MKIKIGYFYKDRLDNLVFIKEFIPDGINDWYKGKYVASPKHENTFTLEGKYFVGDQESHCDLIEEVPFLLSRLMK